MSFLLFRPLTEVIEELESWQANHQLAMGWFDLRDGVEQTLTVFKIIDSMRRRWNEEIARGIRVPNRTAEENLREMFRLWPVLVERTLAFCKAIAPQDPVPGIDELVSTRDAAERIVAQWRFIGPQRCPGLLDIPMTEEEAARMDHLLAKAVPRLKITPRPL